MKVVIADDHPLVRDALARTLRDLDGATVVFEADSFDSARRLVEQEAPELLLLDLQMPGMQGLEGVRRLHQEFPAVALVVASAQQDGATIRAALQLGTVGFLPKTESREVIHLAIRLVRAGASYVPTQLLDTVERTGAQPPDGAAALTARQLEVLALIARGAPNKRIASELGLTEGTVKAHLAAILRTLGARNRTEAAAFARERRLL